MKILRPNRRFYPQPKPGKGAYRLCKVAQSRNEDRIKIDTETVQPSASRTKEIASETRLHRITHATRNESLPCPRAAERSGAFPPASPAAPVRQSAPGADPEPYTAPSPVPILAPGCSTGSSGPPPANPHQSWRSDNPLPAAGFQLRCDSPLKSQYDATCTLQNKQGREVKL